MTREPTPEPVPPDERSRKGISRREFARRAAIASAVASLAPVNAASAAATPGVPLQAATPAQAPVQRTPVTPAQQPPANLPKLPPESQAEADNRFQAILTEYGERFSNEQKIDLRRLCIAIQLPLDRLRAYTVANGDGPGLYLKPLFEREKKPATARAVNQPAAKPPASKPAAASTPGAAKKP
jgi:hypothetical protein